MVNTHNKHFDECFVNENIMKNILKMHSDLPKKILF